MRAGRRWETRGARSARAEAKETQADIVARASDQWRAGAAIGTHAFPLRTPREAHVKLGSTKILPLDALGRAVWAFSLKTLNNNACT